MALLPRPVDRFIDIHASEDSKEPNGVSFVMKENGQPVGKNPAGMPVLVFDKGNHTPRRDWYRIKFALINEGTLDLRFHPKKDQALWAKQTQSDADCPTCESEVACFKATHATDHHLTVRNDDDVAEKIAFTLNFLKPGDDGKDPATYIPFDPITENRNGGTGFSRQSLAGFAVAGVAAAGCAAAALFAAFSGDRSPKRPDRSSRR